MKEALLYQKLDDQKVKCNVCHHRCLILPGKRGICGVRENQNGTLYALNYGLAIAAHVDPIEKKPLFNFMPGTLSYSFATAGCNFHCLHCQNADISQLPSSPITNYLPANATTLQAGQLPITSSQKLSPAEIVQNAVQNKCSSISYTYTEPTIFLEYALDTMQLAHKNNLKNVWVSNGYMTPKTLKLVMPYLDAINVDLKALTEKFYTQVCGAHLQPVLDNLVELKKNKIHLEVTTLIIPTKNDSEPELKQIAEFIYNQLSPDTPWHVTAFYPTYKMLDIPPTPYQTIKKAQHLGQDVGLKYVYTGNI